MTVKPLAYIFNTFNILLIIYIKSFFMLKYFMFQDEISDRIFRIYIKLDLE